MFSMKRSKEPSGLDQAINRILDEMRTTPIDEPEYDKLTSQLAKLHELKSCDAPKRVSRDTLAIILGNLAVAVIVVGYEQKNVVTSKTSSFLMKLR